MTKPVPLVQESMTRHVQTIGDEQTMLMAHRLMRQQKIWLLPVLHQGKLVGIVSDRDLNLIESLSAVDPKVVTVADAMDTEVFVVAPGAGLYDVMTVMAEQKHAFAVVCESQKVVGMLTALDGCAAIMKLTNATLSS